MIARTYFKMSVYACALLMLFSTSHVQTTPTKKALCVIATYIAVHCYWKNVDPLVVIKDQTFLDSILNVEDASTLGYMFDRWIMGRPEKSAGITVSGTTLKLQGKRSVLATRQLDEIDSQKLTLYNYKGTPAYGFFGVIDSYIKMIYKILKDLKEVNEVRTYWEIGSSSID